MLFRSNFGDWGSDEITIPIFELESRELVFEIWEGMPYEMGSEKLLDACYNKPSIWNTYQEETFVLNRRVSGVTSIGFVFHRKAHIKGFSFDKNLKAFEQLSILDNTSVYGDSYLIREDAIEGIGNNVTFVYENMDFSGRPISKVTICGRTPLDKNTIHIRFKDGERTINQIIEFSKASEYDVQEFELEQVEGLFEVLFIFMPGSDFDCKWFQFK